MSADFAGATVLIAGGTSGVGLVTARRFAKRGAHIALMGRSEARGEAACETVAEGIPEAQVRFFAGDANRAQDALRVAGAVEQAFGGIDVLLVSTASSWLPRLLQDIAPEDIAGTLLDQALAPMVMSRAVLDGMKRRGSGCIINVASDAAKVATPGETVLGAAMAAITMFSRAMAMEVKRDGIRVNVLTPSLIGGTPVYDRLMDDPFCQRLFGKAAKFAALGIAEPEDLAEACLFLAGHSGRRITGQALSINGGISAA